MPGNDGLGTLMKVPGTSLVVTMAWIAMAWTAAAQAADCPRKDTLGTSRILKVDAATMPRIGLKSFPQTLPLADHEVVLTFDDGPWPPTTTRVLAALAHECVRATFFLIENPPQSIRRWCEGSRPRVTPSGITPSRIAT